MGKFTVWSALGYLGLTVMSVVWIGYAWLILHDGGFTKTYRGTRDTTFVDGPAAVLVAIIFAALGFIALAVVCQRLWRLRK